MAEERKKERKKGRKKERRKKKKEDEQESKFSSLVFSNLLRVSGTFGVDIALEY